MTTPAPPRRRWFRYSLRTFFVLLTLFCVWLGVQAKWIRDRRAAIEEKSFLVYPTKPEVRYRRFGFSSIRDPILHPEAKAPWSLRLFGVVPVQFVQIWSDDPEREAESQRLERLFPEAGMGGFISAYEKSGLRPRVVIRDSAPPGRMDD